MILFALAALIATGNACTTDTDCDFRCCTYAKEHEDVGKCVEIEDF